MMTTKIKRGDRIISIVVFLKIANVVIYVHHS